MSETPRTDAVYFQPGATMYDVTGVSKNLETSLAAKERELAETRAQFEVTMDALLATASELAEARNRIEYLQVACDEANSIVTVRDKELTTLRAAVGDAMPVLERMERTIWSQTATWDTGASTLAKLRACLPDAGKPDAPKASLCECGAKAGPSGLCDECFLSRPGGSLSRPSAPTCGTCGTVKNGLTVKECEDCLPSYKNWTPKEGV